MMARTHTLTSLIALTELMSTTKYLIRNALRKVFSLKIQRSLLPVESFQSVLQGPNLFSLILLVMTQRYRLWLPRNIIKVTLIKSTLLFVEVTLSELLELLAVLRPENYQLGQQILKSSLTVCTCFQLLTKLRRMA